MVVTDEGPMGRVRGSITSAPGIAIPSMSLRKGELRSLENHALQSGILEIPGIEPNGPLMLNGQEFMVMDGVHYAIEIYLLGQQRTVRRFNWAEPRFSRLFNAIISYAVFVTSPRTKSPSDSSARPSFGIYRLALTNHSSGRQPAPLISHAEKPRCRIATIRKGVRTLSALTTT